MTIAEVPTVNGIHTERAIPMFTFPDSGITVGLQRLAPDTIATITRAIQREMPPPEAPVQEVIINGKKRMERNDAAPSYTKERAAYQEKVAAEIGERILKLVVRRITVEVDHEAVSRLREDMESIGSPIEDVDDKAVYVRHICIGSVDDLNALSTYVLRISQPTEAAVKEHTDSFRGDV